MTLQTIPTSERTDYEIDVEINEPGEEDSFVKVDVRFIPDTELHVYVPPVMRWNLSFEQAKQLAVDIQFVLAHHENVKGLGAK